MNKGSVVELNGLVIEYVGNETPFGPARIYRVKDGVQEYVWKADAMIKNADGEQKFNVKGIVDRIDEKFIVLKDCEIEQIVPLFKTVSVKDFEEGRARVIVDGRKTHMTVEGDLVNNLDFINERLAYINQHTDELLEFYYKHLGGAMELFSEHNWFYGDYFFDECSSGYQINEGTADAGKKAKEKDVDEEDDDDDFYVDPYDYNPKDFDEDSMCNSPPFNDVTDFYIFCININTYNKVVEIGFHSERGMVYELASYEDWPFEFSKVTLNQDNSLVFDEDVE